jgi:signal transduction histidine kinase
MTDKGMVPATKKIHLSLLARMGILFSALFAVLFLAALLIATFGLPAFGFRGMIGDREHEELQKIDLIADLKRDKLKNWLNEVRSDINSYVYNAFTLDAVTEISRIMTLHPEGGFSYLSAARKEKAYQDLASYFAHKVNINFNFLKIIFTEPVSGQILVSTREKDLLGPLPGSFFSMDEIRNGKSFTYKFLAPQENEPYTLAVSVVLSGAGPGGSPRPLAIGTFWVDLTGLVKTLLHTGDGLGKSGEALLVSNHRILLTPVKHDLPQGIKPDVFKYTVTAIPSVRASMGNEGVIRAIDYRGVLVLAAYRYIPVSFDFGIGMVVKQDEEEIYASLGQSVRSVTVLGILGFALIAATGFLFLKRLLEPLSRLKDAALLFAGGDWSARSEAHSTDEVGELSVVFNHMAGRVQDSLVLLEDEVRQRTRKLKEANEELEQFVFIASHDLRSPLVNVQGYGKELEYSIKELAGYLKGLDTEASTEMERIIDGDIREDLHYIGTNVLRMDSLLLSLLKFSRIGKAALHMKTLDMNALARDALEALRFQVNEKGIDVDSSPLPPCYGDEILAGQVLSNLLGNAVRYSAGGGKNAVRISGQSKGASCEYSVSDNGIGIRKEHLDRIFDLFYRVNPAAGEGQGIGLNIVKKCLQRMNGSIRVESEIGRGTVFTFTLPAIAGKEENYE